MDHEMNQKISGVTTAGRQLYDHPDKLARQQADYEAGGREAGLSLVSQPDGFKPWNGGKIPIDPRQRVFVRLRGGFLLNDGSEIMASALRFDWTHTGELDDIVAFRESDTA